MYSRLLVCARKGDLNTKNYTFADITLAAKFALSHYAKNTGSGCLTTEC